MNECIQIVLHDIDRVISWAEITNGSLDDDLGVVGNRNMTSTKCRRIKNRSWSSSGRFLRLNERKCRWLAKKLLKTQEVLKKVVMSSSVGWECPAVTELHHVVGQAEILIGDCCDEDWIRKAVDLAECGQEFLELHLDLQWWTAMVNAAVANMRNGRNVLCINALQLQKVEESTESLRELCKLDMETLLANLEAIVVERSSCNKVEVQISAGQVEYIEEQRCKKKKSLDLVENEFSSVISWEENPNAYMAVYLINRLRPGPGEECRSNYSTATWKPPEFTGIINYKPTKDDLGFGATGWTIKYNWLGKKRGFALKQVRCREPSAVTLFRKEASILRSIQHPHVVQLKCYWELKGKPYLLMELLEGDLGTLIKSIQEKKAGPGGSPFLLTEALDIMLQIAKAMRYLHSKQIAHRDLKCSNILYKYRDVAGSRHLHVKLGDFGTARTDARDSTRNQHQTCWKVGTTGYRAPELTGPEMLTEKRYLLTSDVFSYGMTCFELLTGEPPFADERRPLVQLRIDKGDRPCLPLTVCPPCLRFCIESCWNGTPQARPSFPQICQLLLHAKNQILNLPVYRNVKSVFRYSSRVGEKCLAGHGFGLTYLGMPIYVTVTTAQVVLFALNQLSSQLRDTKEDEVSARVQGGECQTPNIMEPDNEGFLSMRDQ